LQYKGQAADVLAVARKLGVRYVLEGSVRKSADQLLMTAQLIDAHKNGTGSGTNGRPVPTYQAFAREPETNVHQVTELFRILRIAIILKSQPRHPLGVLTVSVSAAATHAIRCKPTSAARRKLALPPC
jgi:hypothetical protein